MRYKSFLTIEFVLWQPSFREPRYIGAPNLFQTVFGSSVFRTSSDTYTLNVELNQSATKKLSPSQGAFHTRKSQSANDLYLLIRYPKWVLYYFLPGCFNEDAVLTMKRGHDK